MTSTGRRSDQSAVRVSFEPEGIGWIEMLDEARKNAFTPELVEALLAAIAEVERRADCKVAILSGTPEVFSSGADADMLRAIRAGEVKPTELRLGRRLMALPMPVIAAAQGHAVGGGFALMLSADLVVLAREARYGANFMALGITPGMGTTRLLETTLGAPLAHELLYTGRLPRGRTFEGRVNAVVPKVEVRKRALDLALELADKPAKNLELLKRTLSLPRRKAFEEAATLESLMHEISFPQLKDDLLPRSGA